MEIEERTGIGMVRREGREGMRQKRNNEYKQKG